MRLRRETRDHADENAVMRVPLRRLLACALAMATIMLAARPAAHAQAPQLHTHQSYVEEVTRATELDTKDPLAVFAFVFGSLPERVKIYPTEGYFYFSFVHNGVPYAGNIRLDASNRDQGKVNFGYFQEITAWRQNTPGDFVVLDASKGVVLEKVAWLVYRLTFRGKSVVFELNDLSDVKPPAGVLGPDETFIGPIFDESATRFFLVFNTAIRNFLYVLDETVPIAEGLEPSKRSPRMLFGTRTGFVYYRDHQRDRKILVGVFALNALVNNYFDGPFDQLPDSFIKGEALREAILAVDPSYKGKIDRFGGSPDGAVRYMIAPYREYDTERDLEPVDRCARQRSKQSPSRYYGCFVDPRSRQ
jgi:hypothetical protein